MTDLTEQWKKGELKEFYGKPFYIKKQSGVVKIDYLCKYGFVNNYDVVEVLAPIPSYKEWQEKQKSLKVLAEAYCKEKEENQQLKELLKECRDMINNHCSWQVMDRPNHYVKKIESDIYKPLLTKIDNAIGEKK